MYLVIIIITYLFIVLLVMMLSQYCLYLFLCLLYCHPLRECFCLQSRVDRLVSPFNWSLDLSNLLEMRQDIYFRWCLFLSKNSSILIHIILIPTWVCMRLVGIEQYAILVSFFGFDIPTCFLYTILYYLKDMYSHLYPGNQFFPHW